jgi:hypothetical protein
LVIGYRRFAHLLYSQWTRKPEQETAALKALNYYRSCRALAARINPAHMAYVDTELFCKRPALQLRKLCETLEIPYFRGKEMYWEFQHTHLYGSKTQRQHIRFPESASYETRLIPDDFIVEATTKLKRKGLLKVERDLRKQRART